MPDRRFDIVVDADRSQQSLVAALVDGDSGLRRHLVATPANAVVLQTAANAIVRYGTVLEADPTAVHQDNYGVYGAEGVAGA